MIAVVVPSRGRPQNIVELQSAWSHSGASETAHLHVVVDRDDPTIAAYVTEIDHPSWSHLWTVPPARLGGALNEVAPILAGLNRDYVSVPNYDVVGFMGDDHRPRTEGWPEAIAAAMQPGGVVYGNDLVHGEGLPTAVFMDSRIVRTLGHFVLPGQIHLWMDNYWKTLGEQLGTLRYLPDVIIEHVHPITGKADWDEHYVRNNGADVWENDERIYKEWVAHQMPADIATIKAALP